MKFSVIMPVYNAARFVRVAVESVIQQAYADWELICVDDCSTDGSGAILDGCAVADSRIKVIHKPNEGVAVARNVGLDHACGEWITWIDADDIYAPWRLEEFAELIRKEQPDLVRTRMIMSEEYHPDKFFRSGCSVLDGTAANDWGWNELMPMGMVWMFACRRELFDGNRFVPGMRIKEEVSVIAHIAQRVERVVQSESRSYFYRQVPSSAMKSRRTVEDCLRLLDIAAALFREGVAASDVAKARLRVHCEDDVIDWACCNESNEGAAVIYRKFLELKGLGVFDARSIQRWRYRLPMWWFSRTGRVGLIRLVERVISKARRFRP